MACTLTIDNVTGVLTGGSLTSIVVSGTADNCKSVTVLITCDNEREILTGVLVDSSTSPWEWTATFTVVPAKCDCKQKIKVTARCDDGTETCITEADFELKCEPEEGVCPSIVWTGIAIGDCNPDSTSPITITAQLDSVGSYTAELRDSSPAVLDTVSGSGMLTLSGVGDYAGSVTFSVVVTSPSDCPGLTLPLTVPTCPTCPNISFEDDYGPCDDDGNGSVTVTATVDSPDSYSAELRDASNAVLDSVSGSGTQILTHTDSYPGGTTQSFTVVITSPAFCGDSEIDVTVPACEETPPPNGEGSGCGAVRLIVAIAAALAILAALLALCIPPAATALFIVAAVFAAIAAVAGIIYAIFCPNKPCKVGLLIAGQAALAAGVTAIVLSACCSWMIFAGLALLVVGLGMLLVWKSQCDRSWCALAKEITKVIGGVVLPVLGVLIAIPLVGACLSGVALAVVSAIFGPIAAFASSC